jgi:hypothetical protein
MACESQALPAGPGAQVIYEFPKGQDLLSRGTCFFEIANEANPNSNRIDYLGAHMASLYLPEPTSADLNLAISGINPVPNHKMVSQPVLHAPRPVLPIVARGIPKRSAAMVNDQPSPSPGCDLKTLGLGTDSFGKADGIRRLRLGARIQACGHGHKTHSHLFEEMTTSIHP